ncbi:MAG: 2-amino-4-hydroxy-6-hydroxymethyldihydropteridine diphosphokinase [Candidatus Cyclobacteriaceae bacterium M3_2C_046]
MKGIFLILGSNLGDRIQVMAKTHRFIQQYIGPIKNSSAIYETDPWGIEDQPAFLNQVVEVETDLLPHLLLECLQQIESQVGRVRKEKWGQRLIDIDILYYHDQIIATDRLKIPHPEIPHRNFTLVPLCEIAAEQLHPVLRVSQNNLLEKSSDHLRVRKLLEKIN